MAEKGDGENLLAVILDINPSQASFLGQNPTRFTQWVDGALAFLNSHLCLNGGNEAALVSAGSNSCTFLYPRQSEELEKLPEAVDGQFEGFRKVNLTFSTFISLIAEEVGINVEGGIFWKKLVHNCNKREEEGGKI